MRAYPSDAPIARVIRALEALGFTTVSAREHVILTPPEERYEVRIIVLDRAWTISRGALRWTITRANLPREDFLDAYARA